MSVLGKTMVKVAISKGRLRISQTRSGRRPMSVETFLRKEKEGTLYKQANLLQLPESVEDAGGEALDKLRDVEDTTGFSLSRLLAPRTRLAELAGRAEGAVQESTGLKLGNALAGGKADSNEPADFPADELRRGEQVEKEHTNSSELAREIAMDHLKEHPEYYSALETMEKNLEKSAKSKIVEGLRRAGDLVVGGTERKLWRGAVRSERLQRFAHNKAIEHGQAGINLVEAASRAGHGHRGLELAEEARSHLQPAREHIERRKKMVVNTTRRLSAYDKERKKVFLARSGLTAAAVAAPVAVAAATDGDEYNSKKASYESTLPWYATALGSTGGAVAGQKLMPKNPVVGTTLGVLAGTAATLHPAEVIGRKLDEHVAKKKFIAALEEAAKTADSSGTMQRMSGEGAARGIQSYVTQDPQLDKPAKGSVRSGDVPTRDESTTYRGLGMENSPGLITTKLASKLAAADEFMKLCGLRVVEDEDSIKVAAMTQHDAEDSLKRLQDLEDERNGPLVRGAAVGAVIGPAMSGVSRLIAGAKRPDNMARQVASEAFGGAVFGGALPYAKNRLERNVEREKIRNYLEGNRVDVGMRRKLRGSLGV